MTWIRSLAALKDLLSAICLVQIWILLHDLSIRNGYASAHISWESIWWQPRLSSRNKNLFKGHKLEAIISHSLSHGMKASVRLRVWTLNKQNFWAAAFHLYEYSPKQLSYQIAHINLLTNFMSRLGSGQFPYQSNHFLWFSYTCSTRSKKKLHIHNTKSWIKSLLIVQHSYFNTHHLTSKQIHPTFHDCQASKELKKKKKSQYLWENH